MSIVLNIPNKAQTAALQDLSIQLGVAATLNELSWVASYKDETNGVFTTEGTNVGVTSDTSPVIMVANPMLGINRKITFLSVSNQDTVAAQVILSINSITGFNTDTPTTTPTQLISITLQPNYTLTYTNDGFSVFDQNGVLQEGNSSTIGAFYQTDENNSAPLTQRPINNFFSGILAQDNPSWGRTDICLQPSPVTPGSYGGSGYIPVITVDTHGIIQSINQVATPTGTVTSFSSGNLSPLFTTLVSNPNTTPALSFSLSNTASWNILGNFSGSTGAPGYGQLNLSTYYFLGVLPSQYGGTGQNSSTSTGVAQLLSGTWSFSTALANGTTATTQGQYDNSTKVANTAYVDSKSLPLIYSLLTLSHF